VPGLPDNLCEGVKCGLDGNKCGGSDGYGLKWGSYVIDNPNPGVANPRMSDEATRALQVSPKNKLGGFFFFFFFFFPSSLSCCF
jgi:hypothetical protein